jgi:hypothetical protein
MKNLTATLKSNGEYYIHERHEFISHAKIITLKKLGYNITIIY